MSVETVFVGVGPTVLAAARTLQKFGYAGLVIESGGRASGANRTVDRDSWSIYIGGQRFITQLVRVGKISHEVLPGLRNFNRWRQ